MIYCIGDSHTSLFSGLPAMIPEYPRAHENHLPGLRAVRLGATLAWNFHQHLPTVRRILRESGAQSGDAVMICAGEIDCRTHLIPQAALQGLDRLEAARRCAERYFTCTLQKLRSTGLRVLAWNAVASSACRPPLCPEYPAYGLCQERNAVTRAFNNRLAELCEPRRGVGFVSIFESLVDERNITRMEYYADMIHLSCKALPLALRRLRELGVNVKAADTRLQTPVRWRTTVPARLAG